MLNTMLSFNDNIMTNKELLDFALMGANMRKEECEYIIFNKDKLSKNFFFAFKVDFETLDYELEKVNKQIDELNRCLKLC